MYVLVKHPKITIKLNDLRCVSKDVTKTVQNTLLLLFYLKKKKWLCYVTPG